MCFIPIFRPVCPDTMHKLLPLLLLLVSCTQQGDIRAYYFPVRELTDGLVYEYTNTGTFAEEPSSFWYYLGLDRDTALYLTATHYADGMTPDQLVRERIYNDGVMMEQLTVYPPLLSGRPKQVEAEILYGRTFAFQLHDGKPVGFRVAYTPAENDDATEYVSLDRIYRGDTLLTVMGEEVDAIVFDLLGEVSQRDPLEGDISPTFTGYEIYARGLGMVEYRRNLGAGGILAGKLVRRIPMSDYAGGLRE